MSPLPLSFLSRSQARRTVLLALAAGVVALTLAACGGSDAGEVAAPAESSEAAEPAEPAPSDFEAAMQAASDRAEQAVREAEAPLFADGVGPGAFGEAFPEMSAALAAYAVELEALAVPEEFRADLARHVSGLEDIAAKFATVAASDASRDPEEVFALLCDLDGLGRNLLADLSPEYAALAFLSSAPGPDLFVGLSPEESDYLDSVDAAQAEFGKRASAFFAAISGSYTSTEALLTALYEAGAGEAWAAAQEVAVTLEPPPRFVSEHESWLVLLEELVRLDRLIGEGARDGDIIAFELNNHLGLLAMADASVDFSPEFALTIGVQIPPPLDPESAIAATSYGQELAAVLGAAIDGTYGFFPTTPEEAGLEAIQVIAPEFMTRLERSRASIEGLTPPEEYTADHTRILEYFDALLANQVAVVAAAESGDMGALTTLIGPDASEDVLCAAAGELSDDVAPLVTGFDPSDGPPPFCSE